jgi:hypothetical protein
MKPQGFAFPNKNWDLNLETATFFSPSTDTDQIVVFPGDVSNGSMSASITAIEGQWNELGYEFQECAFSFRHKDNDHFYVAGIGGFAQKFYIAKSLQAQSSWQLLQATGRAHDLEKGTTNNLRVEFVGDRITLFSQGVPIISATDDSYTSGFCGLRTNKTKGRFTNVDITPLVKPRCFVIMPFAAEMDSVYRIIKETVEQHGVECKRADERYLSEPILDEVKAQIDSADLVIVDFTGQNSNVYFEAGMANALTKKWIILAQSKKDLAFDVKHIRAIMYLDKMGYEQKFRDDLHHAIEETLVMIGQGSKVSFSCPLTSLQNVVTS